MDERRLSTGDVLAGGFLGLPAPKTDIPKDRASFDACDESTFGFAGAPAVIEALEAGQLVEASNYYGLPFTWKEGDVYRCLLLQYRAVTENETFATAEEAAAWFERAFYATDG